MAILAFQGQEVGKPQLTSAFNFCLSYLANIPVTKASPMASCISWAGETPSTLSHSMVECTQAQGDWVASVAIDHNYDWLFFVAFAISHIPETMNLWQCFHVNMPSANIWRFLPSKCLLWEHCKPLWLLLEKRALSGLMLMANFALIFQKSLVPVSPQMCPLCPTSHSCQTSQLGDQNPSAVCVTVIPWFYWLSSLRYKLRVGGDNFLNYLIIKLE